MERYFIIKNESLKKVYYNYLDELKKVVDLFSVFADAHEIEAENFVPRTDTLEILPTQKDIQKYSSMFVKETSGEFRRNSIIGKKWIEFCMKNGAVTPRMPSHELHTLINAQSDMFRHEYECRMFDVDGILYGSYSIIGNWNLNNTEDFQEIEAAEFWNITKTQKSS